ncbi:uncharacterized protein LOC130747365 isoform X3 [Lotus japonicus]|uniref:uncharacterized protein LOC130747365 isoform X3 n=1 Tax=Lotus japonicus TaxID=34305 RepID=UPI002586E4A5|nr:uncharacterized protein LOC130747365 isoform X3 [Lotus japonicus]
MASSDVCPTEDAVKLFLDYLVDPLLPAKSSVRDNPTLSQQDSVVKQVHSVVLLYNYYHRKLHPELAYLPFDEFCKLTVVLKPPLLAYMKFMLGSNEDDLTNVEKQLSLTEKTIMGACNVCKYLDASKNAPNIEGWPISKVAILLIDSKKEYCFLPFGSITMGVWSVVEKSLDTSSQVSEVASGTKLTYRMKRASRNTTKDELKVNEDVLLQVGYSAVREATGIDSTDVKLLDSYTVYSQSKEKAASRFYIMQCSQSQSVGQEVNPFPLKDVIESLQGPLVKKSSGSWTITPVVDYLHVLPYSEIISKWISREAFSNSLQISRVTQTNIMLDIPEVNESLGNKVSFTDFDSQPSIEMLKQKENNRSCTLRLSDSIKEPHELDANKPSVQYNSNCSASAVKVGNKVSFTDFDSQPSIEMLKQNENNKSCTLRLSDSTKEPHELDASKPSVQYNSNCSASAVKVGNKFSFTDFDSQPIIEMLKQNENNKICTLRLSDSIKEPHELDANKPSVQYNSNCSAITVKAMQADSTSMDITESEINNLASCHKICANGPNTSSEKDTIDGCKLIANHCNSDVEKLHILVDSKEILSQTALTALIRKRNELALQQRKIEDDIANCEKKIQRVLTVDGEDEFELKIESIIEGCNDVWVRNQERTCGQQSFPLKRKRLSEAVFIALSPCQELDGVCRENNWLLPTYHLFQSVGGFQANVTVKGVEFQCSYAGDLCSDSQEARESAAAKMLTNLRSMAKSAK